MRRILFVVVGLLAVSWILETPVCAQNGVADSQMKQKLEYSKNILDGLVAEDFALIIENAKALNKLGEQRWQETESPNYRAQNQVFWFTSGSLIMAAEQRNLDGATLAYTQMTLSCINCHKLLRSH